MKFAKELEQDLVPEWRVKYLDYKVGKKKVKAVVRALRNVTSTPKTPGRRRPANLFASASYQLPIQNHSPLDKSLEESLWKSGGSSHTPQNLPKHFSGDGKTLQGSSQNAGSSTARSSYFDGTPSRHSELRPTQDDNEETRSLWDSGAMTSYGSIVASPPSRFVPIGPPVLELPDPAISPSIDTFPRHNRAWRNSKLAQDATPPIRRIASQSGDAYEVGRTHTPSKLSATLLPKKRNIFNPRRTFSTPGGSSLPQKSPFLRRVLSSAGKESPRSPDVQLEAYREFDLCQAQFFNFLDTEFDKIDSFYRMKEAEATERLRLLREQLHEMRDRRVEEMTAVQHAKEQAQRERQREHVASVISQHDHSADDGNGISHPPGLKWMKPIEQVLGVGKHRLGKNTKALQHMDTPSSPSAHPSNEPAGTDSWRDFTRRPHHEDDVPYRVAKRKLKLALQEFYRGLELLKSFSLLNRTAFRKINKKYDKAVKARPTGRYMSEKVNKAWFVQSEVLDGHIVMVEDLYARYFERGNHKIAIGKLRSRHIRDENYNGNVFRNGLLLAAGLVFGIQGIVYGANLLSDPDPIIKLNTSYLFQIYAGYFLSLFLFLFFCLDCRIWATAKINYVFIFEFDTRHNLDWRQLSELPCLFLFLQGLFMWLNFKHIGADAMFLYWPVVLIALSVIILFFPGPILYHRSREWWVYSNFRLLLAGLYPVEFRDFFLGDMYCSLTYATGNLELFFCLYAHSWNSPTQCNSTHSRLLGFLSTVPGIWRALQCLRRYYDTRNAFPHLVNFGKYMCTILFYMSLSLYRITEDVQLKALFIFFATINSMYTSVWDLAMDWSLGNPYAKNPFLRDVLGYKHPWVYYLAMAVDPILRFNWIFYAIFSSKLQHSAILSFFVSFSEIIRRGIWTLFRVENEHCTNVGRFRASRDVPLPYEILSPALSILDDPTDDQASSHEHQQTPDNISNNLPNQHTTSGADLDNARSSPASGTLRRRQTLPAHEQPSTPIQSGIARVGTIMAQAHAQDFERKRRPGVVGKEDVEKEPSAGNSSDEDEEEDEVEADNAADMLDAGGILERRRSALEGTGGVAE